MLLLFSIFIFFLFHFIFLILYWGPQGPPELHWALKAHRILCLLVFISFSNSFSFSLNLYIIYYWWALKAHTNDHLMGP